MTNRPQLRLVAGGDDPSAQPASETDDIGGLWHDEGDADPLLDDPPTAEKLPTRHPSARVPRSTTHFAIVILPWLRIGERDGGFPSWVRLYLYLWYCSQRGTRAVRLTNERVEKVGLSRQNKWRALHVLEARGLVAVTRSGRKAPAVTVRALTAAASTD
jgi:hypothetical protein